MARTVVINGIERPIRWTVRSALMLEEMGLLPDQLQSEIDGWAPKIDPETKAVLKRGFLKTSTLLKMLKASLPACQMSLEEIAEGLDISSFVTTVNTVIAEICQPAEPSPTKLTTVEFSETDIPQKPVIQ